jgi:putative membrane protein
VPLVVHNLLGQASSDARNLPGDSRWARVDSANIGSARRCGVRLAGNAIVEFAVEDLPAVNAALNGLATVLLTTGWLLIKRRQERAHKWTMVTAFAVSCVFLACYLVYHYRVGSVRFQGPPNVRAVYLTILVTHVVLAATVPFLASTTIYLALRDHRHRHRQVARWTLPIWLYVSVTGVVIYVMLYHVYPSPPDRATMIPAATVERSVPDLGLAGAADAKPINETGRT